MQKTSAGHLIYSPTDLIRYMASPFASWMDRYHVEFRGVLVPDAESEEQRLVAETGRKHERAVWADLAATAGQALDLSADEGSDPLTSTQAAIAARLPIIYQAALAAPPFEGFADFLILNDDDQYEVWDAKLARNTKPYYAIELSCYSEMLAAMTETPLPGMFGIILGTAERKRFRVEDFLYYYRRLKRSFLEMQHRFSGDLLDRPEPLPGADHGRWTSHADRYFEETDHLVRVAGITTGQIQKLKLGGIATLTALAGADGAHVQRLSAETLTKLTAQARLQRLTLADRLSDPDAPPRFELLSQMGPNGEPRGLAALPPPDPADVFFDMEGYPLMPGGLEYLFGASIRTDDPTAFDFVDWWAHDRDEEKLAFEGFVDWCFDRWSRNPRMHIYHYAAYEVSAVRRLSTRHDTRQDEVDHLLRNGVLVDLYQTVRHGLRIGEDSYSIKRVEHLYKRKRSTDVATAVDSIVQYAHWLESDEPREWRESPILKAIRDYNRDDCESTAGLLDWLQNIAADNDIVPWQMTDEPSAEFDRDVPPEVVRRIEVANGLRLREDPVSITLADVIDFHRREEKPMWWRMFDRAAAPEEELRDDPACIAGVRAVGAPEPVKRSLAQSYAFDPRQECKWSAGGNRSVMFTHNTRAKFGLTALDTIAGTLQLKMGRASLDEHFGGRFPESGSLLADEHVPAKPIQAALADVATLQLSGALPSPVQAFMDRAAPTIPIRANGESAVDAALRVAGAMSGGCLVVQGPPGTGKTYTAARVITALVAEGKSVGIASNSHKAVINLLSACCEAARQSGVRLDGMKVGGDDSDAIYANYPEVRYIADTGDARDAFTQGVIGGTAWLFTRPEWTDVLDFLFIDEAGQVSLANTLAMARCAKNLVLLGDQMQLEQPVQGSHPGLAGLSGLQYALLDVANSTRDEPQYHAVVPDDKGLFLGESRRMHSDVCRFISDSIYQGRLTAHLDCDRQEIAIVERVTHHVTRGTGIVFSGVEHDGNTQRSDEEVERVLAIYGDLLGRSYTDKHGVTRPLSTADFLFIAPYNAQVRALKDALPDDARVGSVDKFQGQEAPVCILSLCSSYGEYGSRGLGFILDRNRMNVAISRAQCLAVVVGDPRIGGTPVNSLDEMRLVNLFCKVVHMGLGEP